MPFDLTPTHNDMKTKKTTLAVMIASCFGAGIAQAEDTKVLSPVVVTATRVEQDSFDLPMAIDKVEKKDIQDAQLRMTLSESLSRIPGITAQNRNQMAQDPQISSRGFGARSSFGVRGLRVYVDGIPLSMPDGIGNPGSVDLGTIAGIEVMRGPFSAMYGNSSGGVIQLLTDKAPATPQVEADMLFGSFGTRRAGVQATGTRNGVEYLVNYSDYNSDGYRAHSSNEKRQGTVKLGVKLSDDSKLTTLVSWFDQFALDPSGLTANELTSNRRSASLNNVNANARVIRNNTQIGFNFEKQIDANNTLNAIVYGGQRGNTQYLYTGTNNVATAGRASIIARDFYGTEVRLTSRGNFLFKPYVVTAGMAAGYMDDDRRDINANAGVITGSLNRSEIQKAQNTDQFVQGTWSFSEQWDLHAGLRHTSVRQSVVDRIPSPDGSGKVAYEKTLPVAGIVFKANPTLNFYANIGKGFETPTMVEISFTDTSGNGPNLSLKPAASTNLELGTKWMLSENSRLNAAFFDIRTENEIVVADSANGRTSYKNAGKTERQGFELSASTLLPNNLSLYTAVTLLDAKFASDSVFNAGKAIPGTYRTQIFAEAAWSYQPLGFRTGLEARFNSKTWVNDANSATGGLSYAPAHTIYSVRASFEQKMGSWRVTEYARIDNLFDKEYVGSVRVNDSNSRFFEPAPGRNYIVGIKANYAF